jgi:hypothetical protein
MAIIVSFRTTTSNCAGREVAFGPCPEALGKAIPANGPKRVEIAAIDKARLLETIDIILASIRTDSLPSLPDALDDCRLNSGESNLLPPWSLERCLLRGSPAGVGKRRCDTLGRSGLNRAEGMPAHARDGLRAVLLRE